MPLVAILRGVRPDEIVGIADALVEAGFAMIEVPLNSPEALRSIATIAGRYGPETVIGAGTVLTQGEVGAVIEAGGRLIVSPNVNLGVISRAKSHGALALPGYATPTEAFAALEAGADGLKLFPAEAANPAVLKAHRAVFPADMPVLAVGGVTPETLSAWLEGGADGAGLGSALYKPGRTAADVGECGARFVAAVLSYRERT